MSDKDKEITEKTPPNNLTKNSGGPIIPTCDKCGKPFTKCQCQHNTLQK